MNHVAHMNQSCHPCEWVLAPIWICLIHINESWHTYEWAWACISLQIHTSCAGGKGGRSSIGILSTQRLNLTCDSAAVRACKANAKQAAYCVCVCACFCVRKKKRESEREKQRECVFVCLCERMWEKVREREGGWGGIERDKNILKPCKEKRPMW